MISKKIRPIAIVLPQFHPTKENNEWWGNGFTEWTNVTKAKPLFKNHYQPHLPADLGFYDMRLNETREAQAEMAKAHGIEGFCYYHYWFNGKRLLNEPVDRILESQTPDFPFMLCWANENWTRGWDGRDNEILMEQKYSEHDDIEHIKWLCENVFSDERYIKIDGAPVVSIYRANLFPDINKTLATWRKHAANFGIEKLYICGVQTMGSFSNPYDAGFDASIEFQPDWSKLQKTDKWSLFKYKFGLFKNNPTIFTYDEMVARMKAKTKSNFKEYPSIIPRWDNSPRKKNKSLIITASTPEKYFNWLIDIFEKFTPYSPNENFVFINAWNEWAEGNHLEPDQKWGLQYLEATKKAIDRFNK